MATPPEPGIAFSRYFEIVPALTDALKDHVYAIRHQVYCEELAYEPQRPDRREHDAYDTRSLHVLIRSVRTGEFIGCTRIIRPGARPPQDMLPFENICRAALDRSVVDPGTLPRDTIAEVSRLAVIGRFRRRKGEQRKPLPLSDHDFGTSTQPRFPYITIGLYLATVELARLNGIGTLFMLTEERLAQHFGKLGVKITAIGLPVEHRGMRIPSMMDTVATLSDLRSTLQPLYRLIAADIARGL